jgi:mannose/fructose/N-acetylgalactosamine-specific phosphotransferase system component IIC
MTWIEVIPLALVGGLLGLDVVSFPQAMISRPLVAATIGGAMAGHPMSGLLAGAALELIALETLPFGASRYPEWGSAAVVGGALFATHPEHPAGTMTISVLAALATTWVGGWTMVKLRQQNAIWGGQLRTRIDAGDPHAVIGLQVRGLSADFLRGALLTAISFALFFPVMRAALALWSVNAQLSRATVVAAAASVAGGAAWKIFHSTSGARWFFLGGLAVGLLILVSR